MSMKSEEPLKQFVGPLRKIRLRSQVFRSRAQGFIHVAKGNPCKTSPPNGFDNWKNGTQIFKM